MTHDRADFLKRKLETTLTWTLRGGNDPDDRGSVVQAVDEVVDVLKEVINELANGSCLGD